MIQILMQWWDYHSGPPELWWYTWFRKYIESMQKWKKEYRDILEWLGDDYDRKIYRKRSTILVLASAWLGLFNNVYILLAIAAHFRSVYLCLGPCRRQGAFVDLHGLSDINKIKL